MFGEFWRNSSDEIGDMGHSGPGNPVLHIGFQFSSVYFEIIHVVAVTISRHTDKYIR